MKLIEKNDVNIIELEGRIVMDNSDEIKKQIKMLIKEKPQKKLILDLEKVEFLDSTGIGVIISIFKFMNENMGELAICRPSKIVEKIIYITKIDTIINVYPNIEIALKEF